VVFAEGLRTKLHAALDEAVMHQEIASFIKRLVADRGYEQGPHARNVGNTNAEFVFMRRTKK
jgi:hypothetical protein